MKRFTLKPVLAIFTALGLFALYLLVCFPLINTTVFSWEENRGGLKSGSQISGNKISSENTGSGGSNLSTIVNDSSGGVSVNTNGSNNSISNKSNDDTVDSANSSDIKNDILTFNFENPLNPEISDYILVSITAKNTGLAKYPYGSIAVNLSEGKITGSPEKYKIQERARIFVDGLRHNYYIAVGENKYWQYDWNLEGPTLKGQISSLEIEIPKIEDVDIQINSVSLNQRAVFAVDSQINYFFKNYFQLSFIDRYLTPAYIFLILFTAVFLQFSFLLKRTGGSGESTKTNDLESGDSKSADLLDRNSSVKTLALLIPLLLLVLFSFYFINNYIFTVKGYWDSYKQYIISGRLNETYYGFSDFKKFVTWVEEKVPQGQNVIVLVKGEPIYIMAQMAYGLYPRDIKFINISSMSAEEIADKITSLNFAESLSGDTAKSAIAAADSNIVEIKNNTGLSNNTGSDNNAGLSNSSVGNTGLNNTDGAQTYEYIVVLSETDKVFLESVKVKLENSYRENAGFLYKLILK